MMKQSLVRILRPKNLIIVGITQCILYFSVIVPNVVTPSLHTTLFFLLVLDTMLIAGGGFVINDITDYKTDLANKPEKTFILSSMTLKQAFSYYLLILCSGFILALYIAISIDNIVLVVIYPVACGILYLYSVKFKNSILTGNIIVSLFVAFVSGIVLFAERNSVFAIPDPLLKSKVTEIFFAYMSFSFLVNMIREIIKDIEDVEGDYKTGVSTFPVKYGVAPAKWVSGILAFITIVLLCLWLLFTSLKPDFRAVVFLILFVACPLVVIIQILIKSTQKRDFSKISSLLKWIMLAGICSIFLLN